MRRAIEIMDRQARGELRGSEIENTKRKERMHFQLAHSIIPANIYFPLGVARSP